MSKKLRAIWDNQFFDMAALTPSSEVATLPARNLQDRQRQRCWRTLGVANESLLANLGAPADALDRRPTLNTLVLINHNLTQGAQLTLTSSLQPDLSVPVLTETHNVWSDIIGYGESGYGGPFGYGGALPGRFRAVYAPNPISIIYLNQAAEAFGYWKLSIMDPANPDGYFQIGRLFLSYFDEYLYDWAFPWDLSVEDDRVITYNPGSNPWTDKRANRRTLRFGWNKRFADPDKYWRFFFMVMQVGVSKDWVIDPIPGAAAARFFTTLYGRFNTAAGGSGGGNLPTLSQFCAGLSDLEINFVESL